MENIRTDQAWTGEKTFRCRKCGSRDIYVKYRARIFDDLECKCRNCSFTWFEEPLAKEPKDE